MAKRRARLRWPWIVGGIFLFCSGLVLIPAFVTGFGRYDLPARSRQLDAVMAESKRLGLPMTASELAGPEPPAAENAAPRVREIAMSVPAPIVVPSRFPEVNAELDEWLAKHSSSLDEISQLMSERPSWYVSRDWDMGPMLLFPEYAQYKNIAKAFAGRGFVRAKAGNADGAIADYLASKRLSGQIATEPTLISLLVGIAIDAITLRNLEWYVELWRNDATKLRKLEDAVRGSKELKDPTLAMRGEFYFNLNMCRNLKLYGGIRALGDFASGPFPGGGSSRTPTPSEIQRTGLPQGVFYRASMTPMAETWNEVFAEIEKNGVRNTRWGEITDRRYREMEGNIKASEVVASILFPVFAQADRALLRDDVNQDLAIAFVAAHRYRAEHGKWPASLKEIDCEFPDPFNPGKPIQASFSVGAMRVWSVGIDGVDQHGDLPGGSGPKPDDLVFVYPPTARERK